MEFFGQVKEHAKWTRYVGVGLSAYMVFFGIMSKQYYYIIIAALLFLAVFLVKQHVIDENGVDVRYIILGFPYHNNWNWDEVTSIHLDYRKVAPYVMVHIGKDVVVRTFTFNRNEVDAILDFAHRMNPKIYIRDDETE